MCAGNRLGLRVLFVVGLLAQFGLSTTRAPKLRRAPWLLRAQRGTHSSLHRFQGTYLGGRRHGSVVSKGRLPSVVDQPDDPTALKDREQRRKRETEFIVNKGKLVDSLVSHMPNMLVGDQNLDCFRDDVKLRILVNRLGLDSQLTGKRLYQVWFEGMRWTAKAIFDYSEVKPVYVLRNYDPMEPTVRVRWTIRAHPWLSMKGGYPVVLDFMSVFELDETGKVQEHCLTDIDIPRQPKLGADEKLLIRPLVPGRSCVNSIEQNFEEVQR